MSDSGVRLDYETTDKIVVCTLKDQHQTLSEENEKLTSLIKEGKHFPAQVDDLVYNIQILEHIKHVLEYYGEIV